MKAKAYLLGLIKSLIITTIIYGGLTFALYYFVFKGGEYETIGLGIIALFLFIGVLVSFGEAKKAARNICSSCSKKMGGRSSDVSYEYQLTNYKLNFNKQTGKQENTTYYWTIRIKCPHCGSTNIYDYKNTGKNDAVAENGVNNYIKALLKA